MLRSKIPFWFIVLCALSIATLPACAPSSSNDDSDDGDADAEEVESEPLTAMLDGVEVEIPNPLEDEDLPTPTSPTAPTSGQIATATEDWDALPGGETDDLNAAEAAADLNAGDIAALPDYFATPVPDNPNE